MPKILVLFYSQTGNTAAIADAVAEGARGVKFAEVDVRRVDDAATEGEAAQTAGRPESREGRRRTHKPFTDVAALADYDGIVVGSPSGSGALPAALRQVIDRVAALPDAARLVNKVGSAFASPSPSRRGEQATLWSILMPLAELGLLLVPPGPAERDASAPESGGAPTERALAAARAHGQRVATVVEWVAHARSHAHGHAHGHGHSHGHPHGHGHGH